MTAANKALKRDAANNRRAVSPLVRRKTEDEIYPIFSLYHAEA